MVLVQVVATTASCKNSIFVTVPSESDAALTVTVAVTAVADVTTGPVGLIDTMELGLAFTRMLIAVELVAPVLSVALAVMV
jgi:hypothetical protein